LNHSGTLGIVLLQFCRVFFIILGHDSTIGISIT
jgi:hypothetical protein